MGSQRVRYNLACISTLIVGGSPLQGMLYKGWLPGWGVRRAPSYAPVLQNNPNSDKLQKRMGRRHYKTIKNNPPERCQSIVGPSLRQTSRDSSTFILKSGFSDKCKAERVKARNPTRHWALEYNVNFSGESSASSSAASKILWKKKTVRIKCHFLQIT